MTLIWNWGDLMPGLAFYSAGPSVLYVNGLLIETKTTGNIVDTGGHPVPYERNWEMAYFKTDTPGPYGDPPLPGFFVNAGGVSLNSTALVSSAQAGYRLSDTTHVWNDSALNHWQVSGAGTVPHIDTFVSGTMPVFTDTLPTVISTSSDFSLTFNSLNTIDGDSAFVVLYHDVGLNYSTVVSATGGTAMVPAFRLAGIVNCPHCTLTGWPSDFVYSGGLIMVVVYNHTMMTIGGKQYAFIKQREYLGVVTFL
jgi:hypothetical protein